MVHYEVSITSAILRQDDKNRFYLYVIERKDDEGVVVRVHRRFSEFLELKKMTKGHKLENQFPKKSRKNMDASFVETRRLGLEKWLKAVIACTPLHNSQVVLDFLNPLKYPSVDNLTDIAIKAGWLTKRGHLVRNWRRRWFVLVGKQLFYFRTQESSSPSGCVELSDLKAAWAVESSKSGHENSFEVVTAAGKSFMIYADTPEASDAWLTAILSASRGEVVESAPKKPEDAEEIPEEEKGVDSDAEGDEGEKSDLEEGEAEYVLDGEEAVGEDAKPKEDEEAAKKAAVEEEKAKELAAVKIQSLARGRAARQEYQKVKEEKKAKEGEAAVKIQSVFRGSKERKAFEEQKKDREEAAVKIQAVFRGSKDRKEFEEEKEKAKAERGKAMKEAVEELVKGAVFMKHGRRGAPHKRLVFLSAAHDAVHWCKEGKRPPAEKEASMQDKVLLEEVADITSGRRTNVFRSAKEPKDADEIERSFSIVLRAYSSAGRRSLDLAATTVAGQKQWVDTLRMLAPAAKPKEGEKK